MGVGYELVNHSRRERILFAHIPASKQRELAGNPVAAAIVTWYLLQHPGDEVAFVSDTHDDWPFSSGAKSDLASYAEVTNAVVDSLIAAGVLEDHGVAWSDPQEPDAVFVRDLRNAWMPGPPDRGAPPEK